MNAIIFLFFRNSNFHCRFDCMDRASSGFWGCIGYCRTMTTPRMVKMVSLHCNFMQNEYRIIYCLMIAKFHLFFFFLFSMQRDKKICIATMRIFNAHWNVFCITNQTIDEWLEAVPVVRTFVRASQAPKFSHDLLSNLWIFFKHIQPFSGCFDIIYSYSAIFCFRRNSKVLCYTTRELSCQYLSFHGDQ